MNPAFLLWAGLALAGELATAPDEMVNNINEVEMKAHIRFLSDPLLEGRFPGSRGESLGVNYIASQLELMGVQPFGETNGSYIQNVPLRTVTHANAGPLEFSNGAETVSFKFERDYVGSTFREDYSLSLTNEDLVYVGFGLTHGGLDWDDFKDVDIRGKVIVCVLGQPSAGRWASHPFIWDARWNGKAEEAARHGAKGLVMLHTFKRSTYSWEAMVSQHGRTVVQMPAGFENHHMHFYAFLTQSASESLAKLNGYDGLESMIREAEHRFFRPHMLPAHLSTHTNFVIRPIMGRNVVGIIPGYESPNEAVVVLGHHDHVGVREDGGVCAGAIDDASGVAETLAVARVLSEARRKMGGTGPFRRSVIVLFVTSEEYGLHGSTFFARNIKRLAPEMKLLSAVNLDGLAGFGSARDFGVIGERRSTLGTKVMNFVARTAGLHSLGEPLPHMGLQYRADHFSFLREGIPSISVSTGTQYDNRPADWWKVVVEWYIPKCYHTPCDNFNMKIPYNGELYPMPFSGFVQHAQIALRASAAVADSYFVPEMTEEH